MQVPSSMPIFYVESLSLRARGAVSGVIPHRILWPTAPFRRKPRWRRNLRLKERRCAATSTGGNASPSGASTSTSAMHARGSTPESCARDTHHQVPPACTQPPASTPMLARHHLPSLEPHRPIHTWHPPLARHTLVRDLLHDSKLQYEQFRTLRPEAFAAGLSDCPDKDFVNKIVKCLSEGVRIGYHGEPVSRICVNWPSVQKFDAAVRASIAKDLQLGRKLGPFPCIPCDNFVASPLGAFQKRSNGKATSKVRIVHDLSWPRTEGQSINAGISSDEFSVHYMSTDDLVKQVRKNGQGALLAKADLTDAYHHVLVHPDDWSLLGSVYVDEDGVMWFFVSTVLPFGLKSAPALFTDIAFAAKLIMLYKGATFVDHYLDDYVTVGPPGSTECNDNLQIMLHTFDSLGFSVNPKKVASGSAVMEFLGIVIDSNRMELRISPERLESVMEELYKWQAKKSAKKREMLSLIGKLSFVCRVVQSGRTFLRRMIDLAKKAKQLHHRVRLTQAFHADITWWLEYLPGWNGVSAFYDDDWTPNADMELYTDASDLAAAGYFKKSWFVVPANTTRSINWRELYAIVVAAATFGSQWQGKRILFHCDNMCIVQVLCSGTSKSVEIMHLVRKLFFIAAKYGFTCKAVYINTKANTVADALSRYKWSVFREMAPEADKDMTTPVRLGDGLDLS